MTDSQAERRSPASRWWGRPASRIALSLLVLAVCFTFLLRLDLRTTWRWLAAADLRLLVLAALANLVGHLGLKAVRWHALIKPHARVSLWRVYLYSLAGNAGSHALPARAGEALRAGLVRRHGISLTTSAGIQVVEAAVEAWSLLLVALPLPWVVDLQPTARAVLQSLFAVGVAGALFAVLLARHGHRFGRLTAWLHRGASALRSARAVWVVATSTLAARFVDAGILIMVLRAVGLGGNLWTAFLVILAVDASLLLPTTPGGLATFEAAAVGALGMVGETPAHALAFGIAYHAIQQLPGLLAGGAVMLFMRDAPKGAAVGAPTSGSPPTT